MNNTEEKPKRYLTGAILLILGAIIAGIAFLPIWSSWSVGRIYYAIGMILILIAICMIASATKFDTTTNNHYLKQACTFMVMSFIGVFIDTLPTLFLIRNIGEAIAVISLISSYLLFHYPHSWTKNKHLMKSKHDSVTEINIKTESNLKDK